MPDGRVWILAEMLAQPSDALAPGDVIRVEEPLETRDRRHVAANDDRGSRGMAPRQAAHLLHFADVHDDSGDADDIVLARGDLANESIARGKVEDGAGAGDIALEQHQPPRAVEQAKRERSLLARHLVVIQLRWIDRARPEPVVNAERFEDRCEEDIRHAAMIGHMRAPAVRPTELLQTAGIPSVDRRREWRGSSRSFQEEEPDSGISRPDDGRDGPGRICG